MGIPDLWEKWTHGKKLVADSDLDRDDGGLTDLEEFWNQTDPRSADTDGDGFSDYFEVLNGMNPILQADFTPTEPDTNNNGLPDIWEQMGYSGSFHDANGNGFDDTYEQAILPSASNSNFDVFVDFYTTRSATLNWTSGEDRISILMLPTTGTSVKIRLPFGSDTELYLQSSPYGTDLPSGELWKSRMRISFAPSTGQNLTGNALVSSEGIIAHKVVNVESVIVRFPEPLSARGVQTQESATYDWSSTYGSMEPDSGSESWLTVTRLPTSQDEKMTVVTTAELDSQSHVAITSIVEQCSQRMFSVNLSTNNFSPQLGETLGIAVTVPGCIHETNPGWLEIEIVREIIGAMQHVASVDMDISTSTVDHYHDTSTLGGQLLPFVWDGIAQVSLPLADHPDIFNGSKGRSIHSAMPSPTDDVLGVCFGLDQRNSTPIGLGVIYACDTHETIREYYRYRDVIGDVFTVPLSGSAFANLLALISVHEVAHALGLVDPDVLDAFSIEDPHNLNGAGQNIMDSCAMQRMSDILSPSKTRYWLRNNKYYMEFCLPKKKWGFYENKTITSTNIHHAVGRNSIRNPVHARQ